MFIKIILLMWRRWCCSWPNINLLPGFGDRSSRTSMTMGGFDLRKVPVKRRNIKMWDNSFACIFHMFHLMRWNIYQYIAFRYRGSNNNWQWARLRARGLAFFQSVPVRMGSVYPKVRPKLTEDEIGGNFDVFRKEIVVLLGLIWISK